MPLRATWPSGRGCQAATVSTRSLRWRWNGMEQHEANLPLDFVDLLAAFASAEVRYLIIGGYAVGYHDRPRTPKDLDILHNPAPENIRRACRALLEFGAHADIAAHLEAAVEDEVQARVRAGARSDRRAKPRTRRAARAVGEQRGLACRSRVTATAASFCACPYGAHRSRWFAAAARGDSAQAVA